MQPLLITYAWISRKWINSITDARELRPFASAINVITAKSMLLNRLTADNTLK